jgi:hypothetical protein
MTFQNEDNIHARDSDLVPLPHLGRSGRDIRYCLNIRTIESSSSEPGVWKMLIGSLVEGVDNDSDDDDDDWDEDTGDLKS